MLGFIGPRRAKLVSRRFWAAGCRQNRQGKQDPLPKFAVVSRATVCAQTPSGIAAL